MIILNRLKKILTTEGISKNGQEPSGATDVSDDGNLLKMTEDNRLKQIALLTPREHDLFLLLMEGYTLKECAEHLSIKYSTANTHMTGIYRKLGVNSRARLIIDYRTVGATKQKKD